ncbi:GPI anchored serine-threonine rich protein [Aspergillus stella-maris]|uniref:GPI anchored serine-threonine rich protein n=1 Tax=Aspergillus stella-maris TaxID=1810926 RepID=UPI003CCD075C
MRFLSAISLLATVSVCALAQETSTSSASSPQTTDDSHSSCDAQNILDACVNSIQAQVDNCGANEWDCLCEQTNNMLTCYNNCPGDPARNGVNQQRISYCNAAGQLSSTSTSATATSTRTRTTTASETETATSTSDGAAASETADDGVDGLRGSVVGAGVGLGVALLGGLL